MNTHTFPGPDVETTLATVWQCTVCLKVSNPFESDACKGSHLHAHVHTASSDCDGPLYRDYTVFLNDEERLEHLRQDGVNDFFDLHFKERILASQVSFHSEYGASVDITATGFAYREQTDEGYRSAEVTWCEDEGCGESYSQRDVYAEMMGY